MILNLLLLTAGIVLLIGGGEGLVRGSVALATRLGVAPIIIGLTVVAFGTSMPELVVNLVAAWQGRSEIGFGNVIGSNIANVGLLLAFTAVIRPIAVHRSVIAREIPMMLLASIAAIVMAEDLVLTGREANEFNRDDGILLLLLFGVFIYYTVVAALSPGGESPLEVPEEELKQQRPYWQIGLLVLGGLIGLSLGGQLTVTGSVELARAIGVPEVIIGLTLVAIGTSLPELATCIIAIRKGESDMAVGNIVGSNIYNLLFIFGTTAAISPIPLPEGGIVDLLVMLLFSAAILPLALTGRTISRWEGGLLLAAYGGYIAWLALR